MPPEEVSWPVTVIISEEALPNVVLPLTTKLLSKVTLSSILVLPPTIKPAELEIPAEAVNDCTVVCPPFTFKLPPIVVAPPTCKVEEAEIVEPLIVVNLAVVPLNMLFV